MAGTQSRYEWQFKQRLTSGGLNLQTAYLARNTSELGRHLIGTDEEVAHQTGIFRGFIASVVPATLRVSISPGLGQFFDSAIAEPDSKAVWLELRAAIEVTLTAGGAVNPRWDVIEVQPAAINATAEIIDFFNPADNTFSPAVVSVQKTSQAVAQVRTGTEAANPKLPAGVSGWIPIAYVYVAANALALNVDRVMFCRPILKPRAGVTPDHDVTSLLAPHQENFNISGGGWIVAAEGLAGSLANTMNGTFPEGGLPFHIPRTVQVSISAAGNYAGGGLPVVDGPVYAYAAPPPYPAGYDLSTAPRELYIYDSLTTPNLAATISVGARGCIIVMSGSAPTEGPLGQRESTGTDSITDNFWGTVTISRRQMLFIGAAFYDTAIPGLAIQKVNGAWVGPQRKTGVTLLGLLPIGAPATFNIWSNVAGDDPMILPETARRISIAGEFHLLTGGDMYLQIEDDWTGSSSHGVLTFESVNVTAGTVAVGGTHEMMVDDSGDFRILSGIVQSPGAGGVYLYARAYEDAVLCQR